MAATDPARRPVIPIYSARGSTPGARALLRAAAARRHKRTASVRKHRTVGHHVQRRLGRVSRRAAILARVLWTALGHGASGARVLRSVDSRTTIIIVMLVRLVISDEHN